MRDENTTSSSDDSDNAPIMSLGQARMVTSIAMGAPERRGVKRRKLVNALARRSRRRARRGRSKLEELPEPVQHNIALFLYPVAVTRLATTSSRMRIVCTAPKLWQALTRRVWSGSQCPAGCRRKHNWMVAYRTRIAQFRKGRHYLCPCCTCTFAFSTAAGLRAHARLHRLDPATGRELLLRHKCTEPGCDAAFDMPRSLRRHVKRAHRVASVR